MAEKKEIETFLQKVIDTDPKSVLVISTSRAGNLTAMEMVGYEGRDILMLSAYTAHRMAKMVSAYFNGQSAGANRPPVMAVPSNDVLKAPVPVRKVSPVDRAVKKAVKQSKGKRSKK